MAAFSSRGNSGIGIEGDFGRFKPDVVAPGAFIISTRAHNWVLADEVDTNSPQGQVLAEVNAPLAPYYRFESGTSQAAPVVSGMLALMQEFFEQRLPTGLRRTNSPALMKALIINGARSLGPLYDLQVQSSVNYQGWGLVNLTNCLPAMMLTRPEASWPIKLIDQSPPTHSPRAVEVLERHSVDQRARTHRSAPPWSGPIHRATRPRESNW